MESFEVSILIDAPCAVVIEAFWNVSMWPKIAHHVKDARLLYSESDVQVIMMAVNTHGREDLFKTIRVKQKDTIYFIQPKPPAIFYSHTGSWQFTPSPMGTKVIVHHDMVTDILEAEHFLRTRVSDWNGLCNQEEIRESMRIIISNNSLQTMHALKSLMEEKEAKDVVSSCR